MSNLPEIIEEKIIFLKIIYEKNKLWRKIHKELKDLKNIG